MLWEPRTPLARNSRMRTGVLHRSCRPSRARHREPDGHDLAPVRRSEATLDRARPATRGPPRCRARSSGPAHARSSHPSGAFSWARAWAAGRCRLTAGRLAIGVEEALGVRIVDAAKMRRLGQVGTRNGQIRALAWLTPNRIVGVEETGIFVVDPGARRLVHAARDRRPSDRCRPDEGGAGAPARAGRTDIGSASLALLDATGTYRTVVLESDQRGLASPVAVRRSRPASIATRASRSTPSGGAPSSSAAASRSPRSTCVHWR